ncbi:hypothetical protein [Micromonospora sp. NPDC047738]|uniref:hypothetical protein n=1 Tax=unclassified Micromonospora TaxID=2617518 RepID=UPI0033FF0564
MTSLGKRPGSAIRKGIIRRQREYFWAALPFTAEEAALIKGIRRRTFVMFEEQLQRAGDPGADPTIATTAP